MKKNSALFLATTFALLLLSSCFSPTPDKIFAQAVLNSNMVVGFANEGMRRELDQPSVTMVDGDANKTRTMTRMEMVEQKIEYLEPAIKKIEDLPKNAETREMIEASLTLYSYIMPVYKTEYKQLAKLYDEGAPKEAIDEMAKRIEANYFAGYQKRAEALIAAGKVYAAKNNIKVNWGVGG